MLGGLPTLLGLCLVMAVGSFLAGILPLLFSLSRKQLRLITALGTGVLVGTALIVIIPEGAETLYNASGGGHEHGHERRAMSFTGRDIQISNSDGLLHTRDTLPTVQWEARQDNPAGDFITGPDDGHPEGKVTASDDEHDHDNDHSEESDDDNGDHHSSTHDPHAWMGISLTAGFILMYLIDTLPKTASSRSTQPQRFQINLPNLRFASLSSHSASPSPSPDPENPSPHNHSTHNPSSTTTGLLIHALADGIALGASSASSSPKASNTNLIIFLALMLHKAPAAFGLTTTLLAQNLSKRAARAHLIVFSAAAPVGALLTWGLVRVFGFGILGEGESAAFVTGVLLLFSGGTFLYVAVHGLLERGERGHGHGLGGEEGYEAVASSGAGVYGGGGGGGGEGFQGEGTGEGRGSLLETGVVVLGMVLPVVASWGHHH